MVEWLRGFDPLLPSGALEASHPHGFAWLMVLTTGFTTVTWITVTFLTPPEPKEKLREFFLRVRPAALGWKPVLEPGMEPSKQSLGWSAADWVVGCALIYCSLFGIGRLILGPVWLGLVLLAGAALCTLFLFWDLNRRGWEALSS